MLNCVAKMQCSLEEYVRSLRKLGTFSQLFPDVLTCSGNGSRQAVIDQQVAVVNTAPQSGITLHTCEDAGHT